MDVKHKSLRADDEITVCREFTIDGEKQSIRQFLDVDEYDLLNDFKKNAEQIKDCITKNNRQIQGVDDMPYLIAIGMDFPLDLNKEYGAILGMYHEDNATIPVKAFFGDFLKRPVRRKDYPPALLDKRVNLDQLLAINNAMKYPLSYVQGPPGTGKTNTILNTILTAFSMGVRFCLHRLTTIRLTGFSTVCRDCHIKHDDSFSDGTAWKSGKGL